jgi:ATP-dependent Zn protease
LRAASRRVFNLVARNGFSSSYGENPYDGENLLVAIKGYFEADSEDYRIEAKKFIQMQYRAVKLILNQNKELLLAIKGELLTKRLLLKSDLARLSDELINPQKIAA